MIKQTCTKLAIQEIHGIDESSKSNNYGMIKTFPISPSTGKIDNNDEDDDDTITDPPAVQ